MAVVKNQQKKNAKNPRIHKKTANEKKSRSFNRKKHSKNESPEEKAERRKQYNRLHAKISYDRKKTELLRLKKSEVSKSNKIEKLSKMIDELKEQSTDNLPHQNSSNFDPTQTINQLNEMSENQMLDFSVDLFESRVKKEFHKVFGVDRMTLEKLVLLYQDNYFKTTLTETERKGNPISPRAALLITLYFLRQYPTGRSLRFVFGVHERSLLKHIVRTITALKNTLVSTLHWPNATEIKHLPRIKSKLAKFQGHFLIVDGLVIKTHRSMLKFKSNTYDPFDSEHEKTHGVNVLAFIDLEGKIYYTSKLYPAGKNQAIWNKEKMMHFFEVNSVKVLSDQEFSFKVKKEQEPIKGIKSYSSEERAADPNVAEESQEIRGARVLIEHVFGRIQQFEFLGTENKKNNVYHDSLDLSVVFDVICCIHNLDILNRPMSHTEYSSDEDSEEW